MKRIYKANTKLRVIVNTKCNLTGCINAKLRCAKPDGSFTEFEAGIKDYENGVLFYDVQSQDDFDQAGWWILWPEVFFDDDSMTFGESVKFFVHEAGSL